MAFQSIRSRLLAALFGISLLVIAGGIGFTYAQVREHLLREFDRFLEDKLRYHQISAVQIDKRISFRISQPVLEKIHDQEAPEYFQFRFPDGRDVYRSYGMGEGGEGLPRVGLSGGDALVATDFELADGKPARCMGFVFVPDASGGDADQPPLHLVVARDRSDLNTTLTKLRFLLLGAGALATVLVLAATAWIVRRAMRPVADLSGQIDTMSVGGGDRRFELVNAPSELAPVVHRLNQLLGRAEGAIELERQFTTNAAHELRNPLAGLRSQLELALGSERAAEADEATLAGALKIQRQMETLVDNLLALARLDSGLEEVERGDIEPARALRRCWKPFFDVAAERDLKICWDLEKAPSTFTTAPALFEILASNLFDNASSYTPEGGEVEVSAEAVGESLRLVVRNTNAGVAAADLEKLFRRFGRGDSSSSGGRDHAGIGLSLCQKISGTLGGVLKGSVDEKAFSIVVELPPLQG